jgi:hypothetical protein
MKGTLTAELEEGQPEWSGLRLSCRNRGATTAAAPWSAAAQVLRLRCGCWRGGELLGWVVTSTRQSPGHAGLVKRHGPPAGRMDAAHRSKVPRPKPGVTVRVRRAKHALQHAHATGVTYTAARPDAHLSPRRGHTQFAPPTPGAASAQPQASHDEKTRSSTGGLSKEAQEAAVKRVQAAVPHATADVVAKVLSGCDFDAQAAVNTLLDTASTQEALAQWGKADKRGRTPTRLRPPPKYSPPQQSHVTAAGPAAKLPSHIAVYRRGDGPAADAAFDEEPSRVEQARFRRMHHNVHVTLQAGRSDTAAGENVLLRAAAQEARLRSEEEKVRQARVAAECQAQALRSEEERLQRILSGLQVMNVIREADAALEAVATEAQNATHAVDAAAAAAQSAVRSQCAGLRKLIDDRESALLSDVDAAQRAAVERIGDVRRSAHACEESLSAARISALAWGEPGGQAHPRASTDAAVAQLQALAAQLREMSAGAPVATVTFPEHGLAQQVAAFGAVSCAAPPPAAPEPAAEVPHGCSEVVQPAGPAGLPTYAGMVLAAPPCAVLDDHSKGQAPCSPTSPPPPECPEAFPSLPRAHGAKAARLAAKKGHGASMDAASKLSVLAPAGPDSVSDVSSDGVAEQAELWF